MLDDFGDIQRWNPGVATSGLTSQGPIGEGSTRHCDFKPFGGVDEQHNALRAEHAAVFIPAEGAPQDDGDAAEAE